MFLGFLISVSGFFVESFGSEFSFLVRAIGFLLAVGAWSQRKNSLLIIREDRIYVRNWLGRVILDEPWSEIRNFEIHIEEEGQNRLVLSLPWGNVQLPRGLENYNAISEEVRRRLLSLGAQEKELRNWRGHRKVISRS